MILGLDLDGVVADYVGGLREWVAESRGIHASDLPREVSWGFDEWDLDSASYRLAHRSAVQEGRLFRNLPMIEGAAPALWSIAKAGVRIRIVTHRFQNPGDHGIAAADTAEWLDRNHIPYNDLCFLDIKGQVEADIYIDDAPHNIKALQDLDLRILIFDQPWNRHIDGERITNWTEAGRTILTEQTKRQEAAEQQLALTGVTTETEGTWNEIVFPFDGVDKRKPWSSVNVSNVLEANNGST